MEMKSFINDEEINACLNKQKNPDKKYISEILEKAKDISHKGLSLEDTAALLQCEDKELIAEMFFCAKEVKKRIYGNRMVLFAPLYVSNTCNNNCAYCGFRKDNKELVRKVLSYDEIKQEVEILEGIGHKRLLMVYGEVDYKPEWIVKTIEAAYSVKTPPSGEIRRINVNLAPMDVEGFRIIKDAGIGTYQSFQETYHCDTYKKVHLSGKKADYLYRLYTMHRAMEAGIEDVGMGALFGLYDYKFEVLALLQHCMQLEKDLGVGPHTLSFPRIEPAQGSSMSYNPPYAVSDDEFKKIVAISRLAVPYTGMIISTRERADLRKELLELGVSQLSAASRVYPGAYKDYAINKHDTQQFTVGDERSLDETIYDMVTNLDYIPSFCTGCYRKGRTGDHFMGLAKTSFINNFCTPNALFTFAEYLRDYASLRTKEAGSALIKKIINEDKAAAKAIDNLKRIECGESDVFI